MKIRQRFFIALYILAALGLGLFIYALPGFRQAMTKTSVVTYGTLGVSDSVEAFIVRNETVYEAGTTGETNYFLEDRTALRKGAKVLDIKTGAVSLGENGERAKNYDALVRGYGSAAVVTNDYLAPSSGELSYYVDGLEAFFTEERIENISYSDVAALEPYLVNLVRENALEGEPIYKIAEIHKWYILAWTAAENSGKYTVGDEMKIALPKGEVKAVLKEIKEDGGKWRLIFETNRYYEDFLGERKMAATVTTSELSGIIIENRSITTSEGTVGVYVLTKSGEYRFTPIDVLASDGVSSVCSMSYFYDEGGNRVNTVENYDEILTKPEAN